MRRVQEAYRAMRNCRLCPRKCGADRLKGEKGFCLTSKIANVASASPHHGEEPPISGSRGSGTIFFSSCNLRCIFCQNYPISQLGHGTKTTPAKLAKMMLSLQRERCHNINLVTPSHVVPQFIAGLAIAAKAGLKLPIIYNSSGYDGMEALKLLDGIVDIYMPDIKYTNDENAHLYSGVEGYWRAARIAIKEMHRQVGDLKLGDDRIAISGLIVRHLVLPQNISGTDKAMKFIAEEISPNTYVSLMSQYFPANKAADHPILCRRVSRREFECAVDAFHKFGLKNGWLQETP